MFPIASYRTSWLAPLACLAALICAACGGGIETNKKFTDQVARMDRFSDDLKSAMKTINRLDNQIQELTREVSALKDTTGAQNASVSADAVRAIEQRLNVVEGQVKRPATTAAAPALPGSAQPGATKSKTSAAASPAVEKATQASQPATVLAKAADSAAAAVGKKTKAGLSKTTATAAKVRATAGTKAGKAKTGASRTVATATKAVVAAVPLPVKYHDVTQTDTLASIAARYGISAESLLAANNLPRTSRIYVGQKLFIPKK